MRTENKILAAMSASDASALQPQLTRVHLRSKQVLFNSGDTIDKVYFPTGAIVSLVVGLSSGETVEGAMVGRDGC